MGFNLKIDFFGILCESKGGEEYVYKAGGSVCDYQKLSIGQQDEWNSV